MFVVEAMGLEPTNLLTASQALYQLSYAPSGTSTLAASAHPTCWAGPPELRSISSTRLTAPTRASQLSN